MSFRCQLCNEQQPAKTTATKVILETRDKTYRVKDGKEIVTKNGSEIVREVDACAKCIAERTATEEEGESYEQQV